jgi:hypothetical protein
MRRNRDPKTLESEQEIDLLRWQTVGPIAVTPASKRGQRREYLWIPNRTSQGWMQGVCRLSLRALRAACVVRGLAGRVRSMTVEVRPHQLEQEGWQLDRRGLNRGFRELEVMGFVTIRFRKGKALRVTILDPPVRHCRTHPTQRG